MEIPNHIYKYICNFAYNALSEIFRKYSYFIYL